LSVRIPLAFYNVAQKVQERQYIVQYVFLPVIVLAYFAVIRVRLSLFFSPAERKAEEKIDAHAFIW